MSKSITLGLFLIAFLCSFTGYSQEPTEYFYATMNRSDAKELKAQFPNQVQVLASNGTQSAVYLPGYAAHELHDKVLTHGPGYVYMPSKEKALAQLNTAVAKKSSSTYSLSEATVVEQVLPLVDPLRIEDKILTLEGYGTRYHTKPQAQTAVLDLKADLEAMISAAGRDDISVRLVNHVGTSMPSLIVTIPGGTLANEYVILGGHIDSTAPDKNNAPGADDNASGIATITEVFRVLLEIDYRPKRTVEFMAFAAEEIGLVGSFEIAEDYKNANTNVYAYMQLDMTNHNGSANDIYLMTDPYISSSLNGFLFDLMDTYNSAGEHAITYGTSICNYGCSDHFSWSQQGYEVAFPFEATFSGRNPNIHSAGDLFSFSGNATHAAKFAKLGLEYILEAAKSDGLSAPDNTLNRTVLLQVQSGTLNYTAPTALALNKVVFYNVIGQQLQKNSLESSQGNLSIASFKSGVYIAVFTTPNGERIAKKFIVK